MSRRWQRWITAVCLAGFLLVLTEDGFAAPVHDRVMRDLYVVAGERFALDCTYAGRGAEAVAYPRYRGLPPIVYAMPRICRDANRYARTGVRDRRTAFALLVLTHEAFHVAGVTGESEATCSALRVLPAWVGWFQPTVCP